MLSSHVTLQVPLSLQSAEEERRCVVSYAEEIFGVNCRSALKRRTASYWGSMITLFAACYFGNINNFKVPSRLRVQFAFSLTLDGAWRTPSS